MSNNKYMKRALYLAQKGMGYVSTNPMVGAVIAAQGRIIGEGYHRKYGGAHAEVEAVRSVTQADEHLLKCSVMYVTLEPCCHYGKTPPCTSLIISKGIPKVVIAMVDPFSEVSGEGINLLRGAGVEVEVGVMQAEAEWLNRRFITFHTLHRPYIILKWAQTTDGYIDSCRECSEPAQWLTGYSAKVLVHRWRAEEDAIMVGANTVIRDNPQLTVREWFGKHPTRITIDTRGSLDRRSAIFDDSCQTLCYSEDDIVHIIDDLYVKKIQSVIIEGGTKTLQKLIDGGLFDEVRCFVSPITFGVGVAAPSLKNTKMIHQEIIGSSQLNIFTNIKNLF